MSVTKTEGAIQICSSCGTEIICRLKHYENFPDKLQWQYPDGTAHFDKDGNCKGIDPEHGTRLEEPKKEDLDKAKKEQDSMMAEAELSKGGSSPAPRQNHPQSEGRDRCSTCGSTTHLAFQCPQLKSEISQEMKAKQEKIKAGQEAIRLTDTQRDAVKQELNLLLGIKQTIIEEAKALNIELVEQETGMYTKEIYRTFFSGRNNITKKSL